MNDDVAPEDMAPTVDLTIEEYDRVAATPLVEHAAPADDRPVVFDVSGPRRLLRRLPGGARRQPRPSASTRSPRSSAPRAAARRTVLRCFNRMNDLIEIARVEGRSATTASTSTTRRSTRSRCGAASAWCSRSPTRSRSRSTTTSPTGPRWPASPRAARRIDEIVERSLRQAALWDEVKDRLKSSGMGLSRRPAAAPVHRPGLAVNPEVILMDEPCSALDPIATGRIEDLMDEIKSAVHDRDRHPQHAAGRPGQRPLRLLHHRGRTRPATPAPACSSSTTPPRRCSRTPATSGPRTTSPAGSAETDDRRRRTAAPRASRPSSTSSGCRSRSWRVRVDENLERMRDVLDDRRRRASPRWRSTPTTTSTP